MSTPNDQPIEDVARLLAVLVRESFETQSEAILAMSRSGMGPSRIAELLGTSANTVNVTIQKSKGKKGK